ncbi:MFS sugar transporter [Tricharina praecox]|uniref:MFS sugar transporter n=1 Tax=Tricharina praecox TaxID=43433 RepID=UPI00221E4657|nr:MFS sugar transporter [Tricharina praecox]KAI5859003.1 MFS sugar transporter [Tricharina praecox]
MDSTDKEAFPLPSVTSEPERDFELDRILSDNCSQNEFGVLSNPLLNLDRPKLRELGEAFAARYGLPASERARFADAAILAQDNEAWRRPDEHLQLLPEDANALDREKTHRWHQPRKLWSLIIVCATSAAVQGWDQSAINGANVLFKTAFGLDDRRDIFGLVSSAPLLCCFFSCLLLTNPMNHFLGRRGTIFVTCLISSLSCLGQSFTRSWQSMFILRLVLGLGIGPKSATVPVYAAETAPSSIRGALVMQWQMFTAFGIFLGTLMGRVFYDVGNVDSNEVCTEALKNKVFATLLSTECSLRWRLMIGSPMVLPLVVCVHVWFVPESPRWYMKHGTQYYKNAYDSLCQLRESRLQAARDLFYIHCLLHAEREIQNRHHRLFEIFSRPRNRRALQASFIVMFMQQFCGVNTMVHYSTDIISDAGVTGRNSMLFTMGFGLINFVFALPAVRIIDTVSGRRKLLLITFPLMSVFLFLTAGAFNIKSDENDKTKEAIIMLGIYLFAVAYSPGEGPVPFTYSAECYPLYIREIGMSIATAVTWVFNFCVTMTLPAMKGENRLGPDGMLSFYGTWNLVGFLLVLFFVPETKGRSLEELDRVFSVSTRKHALYGAQQAIYWCKRYTPGIVTPKRPVLEVPGDVIPSSGPEVPSNAPRPRSPVSVADSWD